MHCSGRGNLVHGRSNLADERKILARGRRNLVHGRRGSTLLILVHRLGLLHLFPGLFKFLIPKDNLEA